jgi:F-type H+-transporting ATPase subunit epsilon
MPIRCDIVTQDRRLYSGDADIIVAPGSQGALGILPHHAPLLTTLSYGVLVVKRAGNEIAFAIAGGIMEVLPNAVTVLADVGERVDEIDVARAEAAKARAEDLLRSSYGESEESRRRAEASLRRSQLRLDATRRFRKG